MAKRQVCQLSHAYIGKGGQRTPIGLKLNDIHALNFKPIAKFQRGGGGGGGDPAVMESRKSKCFFVRSRWPSASIWRA